MSHEYILELKDIAKVYDNGVVANKNISVGFRKGEILALIFFDIAALGGHEDHLPPPRLGKRQLCQMNMRLRRRIKRAPEEQRRKIAHAFAPPRAVTRSSHLRYSVRIITVKQTPPPMKFEMGSARKTPSCTGRSGN